MDTHSFQNKNFHQIKGDFKSTLGDRVALQNVESLKSHCEYYCTFNKDFAHKLKKQQNYVSKAKDVFAELWVSTNYFIAICKLKFHSERNSCHCLIIIDPQFHPALISPSAEMNKLYPWF